MVDFSNMEWRIAVLDGTSEVAKFTIPQEDITEEGTPLGVRLDEDVRKALTKAAKDDARSISSLTSKIIADWLKANGYLKK